MTQETPEKEIKHIPTVQYFIKTYATGSIANDKKAVDIFKMYESQEKVRRLQTELNWIKQNKVGQEALFTVIGAGRASRYESYAHWGELVLMWIANK